MRDAAEMFDVNIVSSPQFVYHELKLYLKISLIQERTPLYCHRSSSCGKSTHQINPYWCNQLHIKQAL